MGFKLTVKMFLEDKLLSHENTLNFTKNLEPTN